jgi:hypothetical protein
MFTPSREDARRFYFDVWEKYRRGEPLAGLESIALETLLKHPEYHTVLEHRDRFGDKDYLPEFGETNPFLHMSLHVALTEQISIDQPPGIRGEFERIAAAHGDEHKALHEMMECLTETIWRAQRDNAPPDADAYLECLKRR